MKSKRCSVVQRGLVVVLLLLPGALTCARVALASDHALQAADDPRDDSGSTITADSVPLRLPEPTLVEKIATLPVTSVGSVDEVWCMSIPTVCDCPHSSSGEIEFSYSGSGLWSDMQDVAFVDGYALCAVSYGILVLDVRYPEKPKFVSMTYAGGDGAASISVSGGRIYLARGSVSLHLFDLTDSGMLNLAREWPLRYRSRSIDGVWGASFGSYFDNYFAYFAAGWSGLLIADVSDRAGDTLWPVQYSGDAYCLAVRGTTVFVGTDDSLRVFELAASSKLALQATLPFAGKINDVYLVGDHLFVSTKSAGLTILDIAAPQKPQSVGRYPYPFADPKFSSHDSILYIADGLDGLTILDVSEPRTPVLVGKCPLGDSPRGIDSHGNFVYVASKGGLQIIDVRSPSSPRVASTYDISHSARVVGIEDGTVFIRDQTAILSAKVNDLQSASVLEELAPPSQFVRNDVAFASGYAYVLSGRSLRVNHVASPTPAITVAELQLPADPRWIKEMGRVLYVAMANSSLLLIDILDPAAPVILGDLKLTSNTADCARSGNLLAVAVGSKELELYDVSNAASAKRLSGFESECDVHRLALAPSYLYVGGCWPDLQVIDVSDPTTPIALGSYDGCPDGQPYGMVMFDGYILVARGECGVAAYDVTVPSAPGLVGYFNTPGYTRDLVVRGRDLFVADGTGLLWLQLSESVVAK